LRFPKVEIGSRCRYRGRLSKDSDLEKIENIGEMQIRKSPGSPGDSDLNGIQIRRKFRYKLYADHKGIQRTQGYSELKDIQNSRIFRTQGDLELNEIQNSRRFRTQGDSELKEIQIWRRFKYY
jgi:hypothetical protein